MDKLAQIAAKAAELNDAESDIDRLEEELKAAKKRAERIAEHELPELMADVEMEELTVAGGFVVKVENNLHAKKRTHAHAQALQWLRDNDQGGLIKTVVGVPFTAGSEADADELVERLGGEGIAAAKAVEVNASSLAAALRRLRKDGVDLPDYLGHYEVTVAKVTRK